MSLREQQQQERWVQVQQPSEQQGWLMIGVSVAGNFSTRWLNCRMRCDELVHVQIAWQQVMGFADTCISAVSV